LIILVVDAKKNYESIVAKGMAHFVRDHLQEQLEVNLRTSTNKEQFESWLTTKEVIVSFNKKDLLSSEDLSRLTASQETDSENKIKMNKISCIDDPVEISSIDELLIDLRFKVTQL